MIAERSLFVKEMGHLKKMQVPNAMHKHHVRLKMEEEDVTVIKVTKGMEFKNVKVNLCQGKIRMVKRREKQSK